MLKVTELFSKAYGNCMAVCLILYTCQQRIHKFEGCPHTSCIYTTTFYWVTFLGVRLFLYFWSGGPLAVGGPMLLLMSLTPGTSPDGQCTKPPLFLLTFYTLSCSISSTPFSRRILSKIWKQVEDSFFIVCCHVLTNATSQREQSPCQTNACVECSILRDVTDKCTSPYMYVSWVRVTNTVHVFPENWWRFSLPHLPHST